MQDGVGGLQIVVDADDRRTVERDGDRNEQQIERFGNTLSGILVFAYPGESYLGLSALFAVLMFVSGVEQLVMAFTERYMAGRSWTAMLGCLEVILGIMLISSPGITALMLPIFLGIWLLSRGIGLIGIASEMSRFKMPGMGWTIVLGILLTLCALMILFRPLVFGVEVVIAWLGIALLVAGIALVIFAFQLFGIRNKLKNM